MKTPVLDKTYPVPAKKLLEYIFGDVGDNFSKPIPELLLRLKYRCMPFFNLVPFSSIPPPIPHPKDFDLTSPHFLI